MGGEPRPAPWPVGLQMVSQGSNPLPLVPSDGQRQTFDRMNQAVYIWPGLFSVPSMLVVKLTAFHTVVCSMKGSIRDRQLIRVWFCVHVPSGSSTPPNGNDPNASL